MALSPTQFNRLKNTLISKQRVEAIGETPTGPSYLERLQSGFKSDVQDVIKTGSQAFTTPKNIPGAIQQGLTKTPETALRVLGTTARSITRPITEAPPAKALLQGIGNIIMQIPGAKQAVLSAYDLAQKHPEAAKDLRDIMDVLAVKGAINIAGGAATQTGIAGAKATQATARTTGRVAKKLGEESYGLTVTPQEGTARAISAYQSQYPNFIERVKAVFTGKELPGKPITEANTAARKGLVGTEKGLGFKAQREARIMFEQQVAPKLDKAKNAADMRDIIKGISKRINKVDDLGRRNDLKQALETFRDEYKNVTKIGGTKLQNYKEGWTQFLPDKVHKTGKPIASAYREIQNMASDEVRPILYNIVGPEGKQAYIDYGNLKSIVEAGIKSSRDVAKQSLGRSIWQTIMDKAVTPIATTGGKILYKTGEGLEFIGNKGAKRVDDIINSGTGKPILPVSPKTDWNKIKDPSMEAGKLDFTWAGPEYAQKAKEINDFMENLRNSFKP